jgi:predicted negative regulator of RcsB-dependent stress response
MAGKKRRFEKLQEAASAPPEKKKYDDPLKIKVNNQLEEFGRQFEGKGKTILYGVGAVVVIAILVLIFAKWSRNSNAAAQAALGRAIETMQAPILGANNAQAPTEKSYSNERERATAAIAEFEGVADRFGGAVGDKAKYFAAVTRLDVDRPAAILELEAMSGSGSETGKLAKFALAQTRVSDNNLESAAALFQELVAMDDPIIAKDTINFELAKVYERQGKKQEAADLYFNIAKSASEAKDMDGKPVRMSETANDAKKKIEELDPERAKQIVEPSTPSPFDSGSGLTGM